MSFHGNVSIAWRLATCCILAGCLLICESAVAAPCSAPASQEVPGDNPPGEAEREDSPDPVIEQQGEDTLSWEHNDWFNLSVFPLAGARLEVGRLAWESWQFSVAYGYFGLAWNTLVREHLRGWVSCGLAGFGKHFRLETDGTREWGFMFWPLSVSFTDDLVIGYGNSQVFYRQNYRYHFFETGLLFAPFWIEADLNDNISPYSILSPPVSLYVGLGL